MLNFDIVAVNEFDNTCIVTVENSENPANIVINKLTNTIGKTMEFLSAQKEQRLQQLKLATEKVNLEIASIDNAIKIINEA